VQCPSGVEAATSGKPQFPFEAAGQFGRGEVADAPSPLRRAAPRPAREDARPAENCKLTHHPIRLRLDRLTPLMAGGWF